MELESIFKTGGIYTFDIKTSSGWFTLSNVEVVSSSCKYEVAKRFSPDIIAEDMSRQSRFTDSSDRAVDITDRNFIIVEDGGKLTPIAEHWILESSVEQVVRKTYSLKILTDADSFNSVVQAIKSLDVELLGYNEID